MWRFFVHAYIWVTGTVLWLLWALVQTYLGGKGRHGHRQPFPAQADEPPSKGNCFSKALARFLWEGGTLHIHSSPRLPVWRAEWSPPRSTQRWHFEPLFPRKGRAGVWHTIWHYGKWKVTNVRNQVSDLDAGRRDHRQV